MQQAAHQLHARAPAAVVFNTSLPALTIMIAVRSESAVWCCMARGCLACSMLLVPLCNCLAGYEPSRWLHFTRLHPPVAL